MVTFLKNCISTHFRGNYNIWLNQIVFFSCLKTCRVSKNYPAQSPTLRNEFNKGKGKVDIEKVRMKMNKT